MTERLHAMADEQLGTALSSLELEWPAAPDLTPAVLAAIVAPRTPRVVRMPRSRRSRIVLIAAAATLLLAGAAIAAKLVIDLGAVVVRIPEGSGGLPSSSPAPFGQPIDLEQAGDLLGDDVRVPAALGTPDRVWADEVTTDAGTVVRVTLAWSPRRALPAIPGTTDGAVLMRFEGDQDIAFKDVDEDTGTVEPARVGDVEAIWTTGSHLLQLLTGDGIRYLRVDGNVLLWRDGRYTMRLETTLPKAEAIRIAESLPVPVV
jgi:hypothetical protein